jgi:hypothetical protein
VNILFAALGIAAFVVVIGIVVYDEWDDRKRKQRRQAPTVPAPLHGLGRRG